MAQSFDPSNKPTSLEDKNNQKNNKSSSVLIIVSLIILICSGILLFLIFKNPNNPITTSIKQSSSVSSQASTNTGQSNSVSLSINSISLISSSVFLSGVSVVTSVVNLGSVSGYLIYPSDFIPGQNVCAKEQKTSQEFCVSTNDGQETYKINNLPKGIYQVYVKSLNSSNDKKSLENLVYYNQYVADCMMKDYNTPICLGEATPASYHTNIYNLEVREGVNLQNINPWDWYSTSSGSKQTPNPVILPNG